MFLLFYRYHSGGEGFRLKRLKILLQQFCLIETGAILDGKAVEVFSCSIFGERLVVMCQKETLLV